MSVADRIDKIRKNADRGRYEEALELIDGLDVSKVRSLTNLGAVADVYDATGRYEEAYELLLRIYEKSKTRKILYQLACIAVKQKNTVAGERYYREFLEVAPQDPDQYVLRFLLDRLENKDLKDQIICLEKLKEEEYVEVWAFELARLYHKNGDEEKCVRECKDIILWFGDGEIVDKAKALLGIHGGEVQAPANVNAGGMTEIIAEKEEDDDNEQLELELVTEDEEDENSVQMELELELPPAEENVAETVIPEEADTPENEEENKAPEDVISDDYEDVETLETAEKLTAENALPVGIDYVPSDSLVALAVELLEEEDYIVTEENLKDIGYLALEIREEYNEEDHRLQMTERVREIIDRAEKRSMRRLLEVVNTSQYLTSEFLILKKEDFS